jgi:hypothetical protein
LSLRRMGQSMHSALIPDAFSIHFPYTVHAYLQIEIRREREREEQNKQSCKICISNKGRRKKDDE